MATLTTTHTRNGDDNRLDTLAFHAGRADAYDEHHTDADLDTLFSRVEALSLYLDTVNDSYAAYILGYSAYVAGVLMEAEQTRRIANEEYVEYLSGGVVS
ncbi:hypothetical protein TPA0910_87000 [Streptomyces hygroscopicus subsp. sporocinereus]|uniref:Uncharacterized protein n=1 Tax=Streptomyces hygroscopicus TaxID=1912 RepID=A0ABQ3UF85_STRHY|nr:hypothetical protein [Streptomyces hygroscopicus]GHJ34267.1 hypothetical protein TPA0910_87000 [Streptomyces hygroscopicus]